MSQSTAEAQAIRRVAPAPAAQTTAKNRAFRVPAAVDGSAEWEVPGTGHDIPGCWVTITNIGTTDTDVLCFCAYSSTQFPDGFDCATATDFALGPGATVDYWLDSGVDTIKFGGPVTAIASCHRSSL